MLTEDRGEFTEKMLFELNPKRKVENIKYYIGVKKGVFRQGE